MTLATLGLRRSVAWFEPINRTKARVALYAVNHIFTLAQFARVRLEAVDFLRIRRQSRAKG